MVRALAGARDAGSVAEAIFRVEDELLAAECEQPGVSFARVLRDPKLPLIYDVNGLRDVRGRPDFDELLGALEKACGRGANRHLRLVAREPSTVAHLDSLLLPRGFGRQACIAMALGGRAPSLPIPKGLEIFLVDPDDARMIAAIAYSQDQVRREELWYSPEVSRQMDVLAMRQVQAGAEFLAAATSRGEVVGSLLLRVCDGIDIPSEPEASGRQRRPSRRALVNDMLPTRPGARSPLARSSRGGVGFIADVGTTPAYRRRGVASALVAAAAGLAEKRGCEIVGLTARRDGSPRRIYANLGFENVGESVDWLRIS